MEIKHSGRISQLFIYTGKLFRMFVLQNDWKMLPMAAIIAAIVSYVVGSTLFVNMAGTLMGTFGLTSICVWNGCFNSIQAICRERPIVKREHRSGLHITSYIGAHMIYQAFICLCQTGIIIVVLHISNVSFPSLSHVTGSVDADLFITMFLISYASDMISLFVSAIVRNTTTAMTVMPFVMIFQLIFSGGIFALSGFAHTLTDFAVSRWGLCAMCAISDYNSLPNEMILATIDNIDVSKLSSDYSETDISGGAGITVADAAEILQEGMRDPELREKFIYTCGEMAYVEDYRSDGDNIINCWLNIGTAIVIFPILSVAALEFIDKDKR